MSVKVKSWNNCLRTLETTEYLIFLLYLVSSAFKFIICVHSVIAVFKNCNYGALMRWKKRKMQKYLNIVHGDTSTLFSNYLIIIFLLIELLGPYSNILECNFVLL